MEKTMLLIETIPGFDMRLKMQGDRVKIIEMLCGAMTVVPELKTVIEASLEFLPEFQQAVNPTVTKDFRGNVQQ